MPSMLPLIGVAALFFLASQDKKKNGLPPPGVEAPARCTIDQLDANMPPSHKQLTIELLNRADLPPSSYLAAAEIANVSGFGKARDCLLDEAARRPGDKVLPPGFDPKNPATWPTALQPAAPGGPPPTPTVPGAPPPTPTVPGDLPAPPGTPPGPGPIVPPPAFPFPGGVIPPSMFPGGLIPGGIPAGIPAVIPGVIPGFGQLPFQVPTGIPGADVLPFPGGVLPGFPAPGFPVPGFPAPGFPAPGFPDPGAAPPGFPFPGFPVPEPGPPIPGGGTFTIRFGDRPAGLANYWTGNPNNYIQLEPLNPHLGPRTNSVPPYPGWQVGTVIVIPATWNMLAKPMPQTGL